MEEIEKSCKTCFYEDEGSCLNEGDCEIDNLSGWKPKDYTENNIEKVETKTKINPLKSSMIFQNCQNKIYVSIRYGDNVFRINPFKGESFVFEGGSNSLKRWRGVAELILEAVDYLEKGSV